MSKELLKNTIKIRPCREIDIPNRVKWLNNPKANRFIGDTLGQKTTLRKQREWFLNYTKDASKKFFTITVDKKPVGVVGLSNISHANKNANLFIIIGEDEYRGIGIGREAMLFIIDFAFKKLKLHKINLGVVRDNISAVRLYKKLGFKLEGTMHEEIYHNGKFHDFLSMALFKN